MAVIADDLRAGFLDVVRNEKRTIVAYATGVLLIVAGAVFDDSLRFRGGPMTVVGGVMIALAIFVPFVTAKVTERLRPDIDTAITEVYSTMHDAIALQREEHALDLAQVREEHAADLREVREIVADVRAQLR